ncbi:testis-expressed protein 36 isoform X2 [Neopsephotus bourkii]|uniref:testis-expressed protein 36 isoform X2 n=1 Tax=Neopsephotus bourkii TaxID=309878 RepID=UPI002AA535E2|nr:testis-expressed protein 36 isoform X2 [Neopsephotus bourkii]
MHRDRRIHRSPQCTGNWFAHIGVDQNQAEATTSSAQNQVQNNKTAPYTEEKLPLAGTAQEQGLGRRKVEPERRQQNSQNFLQWADKPAPSKEDGLTIYQTSFMKGKSSASPVYRQYPKQHTEKQCTEKPILEKEKNLQPNKSS